MAADALKWEGNSEQMYQKILSSAPGFMRNKAEENFKAWIETNGISTMTESLLEEHIKQTVPAPMQLLVLGQIASMKSK